jgi:hypothetical protein
MQPPGSTYAADCFRKAWRPFDETFIGLDRTTFTNERVDNVFDVTNGTQDLPACDVLVLIAGWSGREATRGLSIHVGWHWLLATSAAQPPEGAYPDSMPLAASRHRFRATCATPRHNESGHAAAGHNCRSSAYAPIAASIRGDRGNRASLPRSPSRSLSKALRSCRLVSRVAGREGTHWPYE